MSINKVINNLVKQLFVNRFEFNKFEILDARMNKISLYDWVIYLMFNNNFFSRNNQYYFEYSERTP